MQKEGNYLLEEYVSKTIGLTFSRKGSAKDLIKGLPQYLEGAFGFSFRLPPSVYCFITFKKHHWKTSR